MTLGKFNWRAFFLRKPLKLIYYLHKLASRCTEYRQYRLKSVVRLKHCWLNEYWTFHKLRQHVGLLSFLDLQQINGKKEVIVIETAHHTKAEENAPNRPWHSKMTKKDLPLDCPSISAYLKCITFHKQKRTWCTMGQIQARNPRRKRRR